MPKMPRGAKVKVNAKNVVIPPFPDDLDDVDLRIDHLVRPRARTRATVPRYSRDAGVAMRAFERLAKTDGLGLRLFGYRDPMDGLRWAARVGQGYQHDFDDSAASDEVLRGASVALVLCLGMMRHCYADRAALAAERADGEGHSFRLDAVTGQWSKFMVHARHSEGGTWEAGCVSRLSDRKDARDAARYLKKHCWEELGMGWWRPEIR
jgi:hypothetical protein